VTVGIVFVSHSPDIANGLVELARQMAPDVVLAGAGGTDDGRIGTSFDLVNAAIASADSEEGVVILCDLGSAVLTAETALDFLDEVARARVDLVDAPLVEGGVAAAVAAQTGADRAALAAAARDAGSVWSQDASVTSGVSAGEAGEAIVRQVTLVNKDGLHARPAADFVKLASTFDAQVTVNGTDAKSLLGIMSLGLVRGATISIEARGPEASRAVDALSELITTGFGEAG